MDPQERLFLEVVWECLEPAGRTVEALRQRYPRVGVFVGIIRGDHQADGRGATGDEPGPTSIHSSVPNRVSGFFDLRGPSVAVDTGCSSSLTALHLACESIRRGECDAAIAGGVNLLAHPEHGRVLGELDLLSTTCRCDVFGADGDGWLVGEGVGAVLLCPAGAARRAGHSILALVRGTATAHRGRSRGRTLPSVTGQANAGLSDAAD